MKELLIIIGLLALIEGAWSPRFIYAKYSQVWVFWYNKKLFDVRIRNFIKLN